MLVENGADLVTRGYGDVTPIHIAAMCGHEEVRHLEYQSSYLYVLDRPIHTLATGNIF